MTAARRLGLLLLAVPALLICLSGVAFAHVKVTPTTAVAGSETTFTFQVPTERSDASTVKIVLALPAGRPIPVVSLEPVPGWSGRIVSHRLSKPIQTDDGPVSQAVDRVIWTSEDKQAAIAPGQFQQFTIAAGPVPDTRRLVFKVLQYYSDGSVVRWIDPPSAAGEPAHPAPIVTIGSGPMSPDAGTGGGAGSDPVGGDGWIAVAGFVAGLFGLAAGTAALVAVRRARGDGRS